MKGKAMGKRAVTVLTVAFLLVAGASLSYSEEKLDLNTYYAYPWSIGFSFDNYSPYLGTDISFEVYYALSVTVRYPLSFAPTFQPFIKIGTVFFNTDTSDTSDTKKWQNSQYYVLPGIGWTNKIAKNFEVGVDVGIGYSMCVFPFVDVLDDPPITQRTDNLLAMAAGRLSLNLSYNLCIDLIPSLLYRYSFSPLSTFDGLTFTLGINGSYRFGDDPDSPKSALRSIKFGEAAFPPIYAAMQSYYAKNPFAKITMKNTEGSAISDVTVSFFQAGFMDTPTKLASFSEIEAGKTVEVDVRASFNGEVFNTNGDTPLNGEIVVEYTTRNRAGKQTLPVSYVLYDRTSISWDDDRKEAAFITKADTALRNYATFARQAIKDRTVPGYSESVQTGMAVYNALKELGIIYQLALTSSFAAAKANPLVVDHVHLPRETLKRRAGDCSDLTALYCAMLESTGVPTGFITVPGHIYPIFNTKIPTASYRELHPDKDMSFDVNGELWIPVEITMVGTSDFLSAWRKGIDEWRELEKDPKQRAVYFTAECQEIYHAVGLKEEDLGLQYGETAQKIADSFRNQADSLIDAILASFSQTAATSNAKTDYNRLGIVAAQLGRYDQAQQALNMALSLDRNYLSAIVNLGNVYFLKQDYQNALRVFHQAEEDMSSSDRKSTPLFVRVLLNIGRSYYELDNFEQAASYYKKIEAIDPSLASSYGYLKSGEGGGTKEGKKG